SHRPGANGSARRTAQAEEANDLSLPMQLADDFGYTTRRCFDRPPSIARLPDAGKACPCRGINLFTADLWSKSGRPQHTGIDDEGRAPCLLEQVTHELKLDSFCIQRAD